MLSNKTNHARLPVKTMLPKAKRVTFDNANLPVEHPELHHYTTEQGLKGIFSTKSIWATHFSDLNDASEVKFLEKLLAGSLSDRFASLMVKRQTQNSNILSQVQKLGGADKVGQHLAERLVRIMYEITFEGADAREFGSPFISSFCSHSGDQRYEQENGLLSQWRGYGGVGGYCIVFDTAKLVELLAKEFDAFEYVHLNIGSARYNYEGDDVADTFAELIGNCEQILSEALDGNMEPSARDAMAPFLEGATLSKHQAFYEEREVRIVAIPLTDEMNQRFDAGGAVRSLKQINSLQGGKGARRHISLFENLSLELPIRRVIIGPSRDQQTNVIKARDLLGSRTTITKSSTPFVG
jgi:hypothetical protein